MNCDKTFSCCVDLHDNALRFGGTLNHPDKDNLPCVFTFRDKACGAKRDPTDRELNLYDKLTSQRRLVAHLEAKIAELEEAERD